jgi:hypothetical protein
MPEEKRGGTIGGGRWGGGHAPGVSLSKLNH